MTSPAPPTASEPAVADGSTELIALLGYAELTAVERLVAASASAPDLAGRVSVLGAAAVRMDHYRALVGPLTAAGADPIALLQRPQVLRHCAVVDDFHTRTTPRGWPEALLKAWAVGGVSTDFYAEVGPHLPEPYGSVVSGFATILPEQFGREQVAALLHDEPALNGRLALWARRLVGEVMTRAQRLAAAEATLAGMVTGAGAAELTAMVTRLLKQHNERMSTVGLLA